jgi:hypothetical protein
MTRLCCDSNFRRHSQQHRPSAAVIRPVYGKRHVRTGWYGYNWRDRCAYAGYYCLYAYDGYVYHYPFDDRASAYAYRWRRHRF